MKQPLKWFLSLYGPVVMAGVVIAMVAASMWSLFSPTLQGSPTYASFFAAGETRFSEHVAGLYASGKVLDFSSDFPVAWDTVSIHYLPLDITYPANAEMLKKIRGLHINDLEGGRSLLVFYQGDTVVDTVIYFINEVVFYDSDGVQIEALALPRSNTRFRVQQTADGDGDVLYECHQVKDAGL